MRWRGEAGDPDGVTVELSPTAHMFKRGHRLRIPVGAGAFPAMPTISAATNPVPTDTTPHVTTLEPFHDAAHPSAILAPVK